MRNISYLISLPDGICNPVRNVLCNGRTVVCGHKVIYNNESTNTEKNCA